MNDCVLITGHAGGLGSAMASEFADAGYDVIGIDSRPVPERESVLMDLTQAATSEPADLRARLADAIGGRRVTGLVNNAAEQRLGSIEDLDPSDYVSSFLTNVLAPLQLTRAILPELRAAKATVLNVGSIHSGQTKPGFAAYSISKAALSGLSRAMAVELGRDIRVIELQPAAIATPMLEAGFEEEPELRSALDEFHPTGRIGTPPEIAALARQLMSLDAPFLNGAVINVDGGIAARLHDPV